MAVRQHYHNEAAGPVTTTSNTVWSDVVGLTFTPDASSDYIVFWSFALQNASNATADAQARFRMGGTAQGTINVESRNTAEYPHFGGFFHYQSGGSPSSITADVQIKAETSGNTINAKTGSLVALKLNLSDGFGGDGDFYAESLAVQALSTSATTMCNLPIYVPTGGRTYLIIAYGEINLNNTGAPAYIRLTDGTNQTAEVSVAVADTTNYAPFMLMWKLTRPADDGAIALRVRAHSGITGNIANARIVMLDVTGFDDDVYADLASDNGGADTTFATSLTTGSVTVAGNPHLLLGGWFTSSTTSGVDITTQLQQDGTPVAESIRRVYNAAQVRQQSNGFAGVVSPSAGSREWRIQRKTVGAVNSYVGAGSAIALLDLGSAGGTPSATPNSAAHVTTASSPTVAVKSTVTPNGTAHDQVASSPTVAAKSSVTPASAYHGNLASSPTIAAHSTVAPDSAAHASTASSPSIGAPVAISPDSAYSETAASSPTVTAKSSVAPDSSAHAHTASSPAVTTANSVAPDNAAHVTTGSEPSIAAKSAVSVNSAAHLTAASSPSIGAAGSVLVDGAVHEIVSGSPSLSGSVSIVPASAFHGHVAGSPTIAWRGVIVANDAAHEQVAGSPTISSGASITPASAFHAHVATEPALSTTSAIAIASAFHDHFAASPTIFKTVPPSPARAVVGSFYPRSAQGTPINRHVTAVTVRRVAS